MHCIVSYFHLIELLLQKFELLCFMFKQFLLVLVFCFILFGSDLISAGHITRMKDYTLKQFNLMCMPDLQLSLLLLK